MSTYAKHMICRFGVAFTCVLQCCSVQCWQYFFVPHFLFNEIVEDWRDVFCVLFEVYRLAFIQNNVIRFMNFQQASCPDFFQNLSTAEIEFVVRVDYVCYQGRLLGFLVPVLNILRVLGATFT